MGFFLVGRVADDGTLRLITPTEFQSRQAAIDELSRMTVDPELESEVHVVDLETATPILIVRQQAAEPDAATSKPNDDLADALRRAAGAMEEDGIQAPESIGMPTPDLAEDPVEPAEAEHLPVDEPIGDVSPDTEDKGDSPSGDESEDAASGTEQTTDDSWPWDSGENKQLTPEPDVSTPPSDEYVIDPLEEPSAADDDGIVVHTVGDADAVGPARTVVMGTYADADSSAGLDVVAPDEEPPPPPPVVEEITPEEAAPLSEPVSETPPPPPPAVELEVHEPEVESGILADLEIPDAEPEDQDSEYAGQDIDLGALACDDCVYVNTCPNKDEREPADCGSFQWKSG